jgi:hypothetical protein
MAAISAADCHRTRHPLRDTVTLSEEDDLRKRLLKLVKKDCQHVRSIEASSAGVRRKVCQVCGHISFEMTARPATATQTQLDEAVGL